MPKNPTIEHRRTCSIFFCQRSYSRVFVRIRRAGWIIYHFTLILVDFIFCQLNLIVLFPYLIKYYHILFIVIVFWLGCDRPSIGTSFFRARFASFHTHASLLVFFICFFVLFHSCCSHARVFGKILVHEFPVSYSHTEYYLLSSLCEGNE